MDDSGKTNVVIICLPFGSQMRKLLFPSPARNL